MHFTSVLRKQFAANDTFLREVNGYKRALALRNAWQNHSQDTGNLAKYQISQIQFGGWLPF